MIVDAHLHVWRRARSPYGWLRGDGLIPVAGDHPLEDALPALRNAGVDAVVLVQADDADGDTDLMSEEADAHPEVAGVVGWLPLDDEERAAARLEALRRRGRLAGVRSLIHDRPDDAWILGAEAAAGLALLEREGIPFDYVTADPRAMRHLPELAARHPDLTIVLDHLGKPPVGGDLAPWRELLRSAAGIPRLVAKVSGLSPIEPDGVRVVVGDALEILGAERLLYGGDWPMVDLAGGYGVWWGAIHPIVDALAPDERSAILGGTAQRVYGLPPMEE
jgi:L-fuconolactonase